MDTNTLLIIAGFVNFVTLLGIGYKITRHLNLIEFKVNMMWNWFKNQMHIDSSASA
jgi:hypothetical protein